VVDDDVVDLFANVAGPSGVVLPQDEPTVDEGTE